MPRAENGNGRNRAGGVVWRRNVKAHASSAATRDNHYWYDGLRQVARHDRGDLMPASGPPYTGIDPATRRQMEVFTFDETGNRPGYFSQTPPLAQGRGHDRANQIISITGPAGVVQPAYDPAGNMTRMPRPGNWSAAADLTWDAWNRLVRIRDHSSSSSSASSSSESSSSSSSHSSSPSSSSSSSSSSDSSSGSSSSSSIIESSSSHSSSSSSSSSLPSSSGDSSASESSSDSSSSSGSSSSSLASSGSYHSASSSSSGAPHGDISYQYDARTRRTRKSKGAETRDYYYDSQWRAIEERVAGSVAAQYVWSPLDRWTMIRRKRGGEELYVLRDHLDPAAIIDTGGTVVERFGYDAFGPARFMDAAFSTLPASNADWNFLFHAEFLDTDSGLYNYGYRYYHPELGRWLSRDPIEEMDGLNLYAFVRNNGINYSDFIGRQQIRPPGNEGGELTNPDGDGFIHDNETGAVPGRPFDPGSEPGSPPSEYGYETESETVISIFPYCVEHVEKKTSISIDDGLGLGYRDPGLFSRWIDLLGFLTKHNELSVGIDMYKTFDLPAGQSVVVLRKTHTWRIIKIICTCGYTGNRRLKSTEKTYNVTTEIVPYPGTPPV